MFQPAGAERLQRYSCCLSWQVNVGPFGKYWIGAHVVDVNPGAQALSQQASRLRLAQLALHIPMLDGVYTGACM